MFRILQIILFQLSALPMPSRQSLFSSKQPTSSPNPDVNFNTSILKSDPFRMLGPSCPSNNLYYEIDHYLIPQYENNCFT